MPEERDIHEEGNEPPKGIGVYDRPERTGPSSALIATLVILLLLIVFAVFAFQWWF